VYTSHVAWVHLTVACNCWFAVLKKRKVEHHDDFILGPVSPKEYKHMLTELNGSRTNRVFEFLKVSAPERFGVAKHREATERKLPRLPPPKMTLARPRRRLASEARR
jgi:hypothetical protein